MKGILYDMGEGPPVGAAESDMPWEVGLTYQNTDFENLPLSSQCKLQEEGQHKPHRNMLRLKFLFEYLSLSFSLSLLLLFLSVFLSVSLCFFIYICFNGYTDWYEHFSQ